MTFEEMERTMEFILNQQAKFSVDIDLLKESQATLTADVAKLTVDMAEMKVQAELDRQLMKAMFKHFSDSAEADRRMVREMVQDLKGLFYQVDAKADKALRLAQKNDVKE
ncbi:MAG TPA: hypothetical protein PLU80_08430 [Acidobacteriota bacterium]|nr:hypothetical protein [Acidobacteriota bacterium]HNG94110.1 hypothetical protein [Acidobacteriota bacterium]